MLDHRCDDWTPAFRRRDRNTRALAKAIEAGMRALNAIAQQGFDCIAKVETMPEWRLDELAWEYNLLYDETADIETKRGWIADALSLYTLSGTAAGIEKYLRAAFDTAQVEEWFDYEGEPFHFRVNLSGKWSEETNAWAYKTIERIKNVRSVLDSIVFDSETSRAALDYLTAVTDAEIIVTSREAEGAQT